MNKPQYNVMFATRDDYGNPIATRLNMVNYRNLETAKRRADAQRGGYVIPRGSNAPVYVGSWQ